jgi:hypothetical protein
MGTFAGGNRGFVLSMVGLRQNENQALERRDYFPVMRCSKALRHHLDRHGRFNMKKVLLIKLTALTVCLLTSVISLAGPEGANVVGESRGEIWVDGPADVQPGSDPNHPDAAVDNSGRSIFVWDGTPSDTRKEIFLRIFPADGSEPDAPVQVNTFVEEAQDTPRVAVSGDGSFLVVWLSREPEPSALRAKVRSQAFDTNEQPVGSEQLLSTLPTNQTSIAKTDVAALRDGGYIVVWRSANTPEAEDNSTTIQGRRIGANGVPLAGQFQVNSTMTSAAESFPAVTELADGGFLVVWTTPQVHGRRFAADGTPDGIDFQINTFVTGTESETDVVLHQDGRVLVIWKDAEESGDDTEIRGRLFSQDLIAQGVDFRVNTLITGVQNRPRAADYGRGGFFVVWESAVSAGNDNDAQSIAGRIVTGSNQFAGSEFQVNDWTTGGQQIPGIGGKNDRIAVGWHSKSNPDTTNNVINGQFWSICGIFCDGFEGE